MTARADWPFSQRVVTLDASFGEPKYFEACPDPAAHRKKSRKMGNLLDRLGVKVEAENEKIGIVDESGRGCDRNQLVRACCDSRTPDIIKIRPRGPKWRYPPGP